MALLVNQWRKSQVHMIGHDDRHIQFVFDSMVVKTRSKHQITRLRWQNPSELRNESDEVRREIFLQMRQISSIKLHAQILPP